MTRSRIALLLVFVLGAVFLEGVDVSMMGVALPSIRAELGLSTSELQWIVSAYVLGYGGFVLLGGRAADLLGRRRMFLAWMAVFVVFSGLGGIADSGALLIVARFVTGVAAGFMAPAGLSIITSSFPEGPSATTRCSSTRASAAAGFSLGHGRRRAADGDRLALGVLRAGRDGSLLLAVAWRVVPHDAPAAVRGAFDLGGALSLTGAMILLVFTVVRAPDVDGCPSRSSGSRRAPRCSPRSSRSSGARRRRSSGSASCARPRWCARTSARCCSSARSWPSSSSPCSTCRSCAAGRRWRPASP